jgi:hypothetical protein
LELIVAFGRHEAIAAQYRDARGELAALKRQFLSLVLERTPVPPGQRCGTVIDLLGKAMATATLTITGIEQLPDGARLITASGPVKGALKKGLRKLGDIALTQMRNRGLGPAGEIRSARIENGIARIVARISSAVAAMKVEHRVYPALDITHDGAGTIYSVDLVDRPGGDVLAKRGVTVFAKLYRKEGEVKKSMTEKAAQLLIKTPLRPDSGNPEERRFAEAAFATLYKASVRKGAINDWRLRLGR